MKGTFSGDLIRANTPSGRVRIESAEQGYLVVNQNNFVASENTSALREIKGARAWVVSKPGRCIQIQDPTFEADGSIKTGYYKTPKIFKTAKNEISAIGLVTFGPNGEVSEPTLSKNSNLRIVGGKTQNLPAGAEVNFNL